jgi:hypothetical protein
VGVGGLDVVRGGVHEAVREEVEVVLEHLPDAST